MIPVSVRWGEMVGEATYIVFILPGVRKPTCVDEKGP